LVESYRGYNLVHYLDEALAVPQSLGPLNLANPVERRRPGILSAKTIEMAKSAVDAVLGTNGEVSLHMHRPILVETYNDHNLVRLNGKVLAVPLSLGPIDLTEEKARFIPQILSAASIEEARKILDGQRAALPAQSLQERSSEPMLVEEGYKEFNLIFYAQKYYAILQKDGSFDPARISGNRYTCIYAGDTLGELKGRIDRIPFTWRVGFRLKPILINRPLLWRTAQKLQQTFTNGGVA